MVTAYSIDGKIVFTQKYSGLNKVLDLDFTNQLNTSRVLILNIEAGRRIPADRKIAEK